MHSLPSPQGHRQVQALQAPRLRAVQGEAVVRMTRPSINHTLLSPSGHVSKRARRAALKTEEERLAKEWGAYIKRDPDPKLSRIERLRQIASGHPDNESVRAAKRLLAREKQA